MHRKLKALIPVVTIGCVSLCLTTCQPKIEPLYQTSVVALDQEYTQQLAKEIQDQVSLTLAEGITVDLWASDTLVTDPIAISIDDLWPVVLYPCQSADPLRI